MEEVPVPSPNNNNRVCVVHRPDMAPYRHAAVMGDDVLFRMRLAFEKDPASLAVLVPGAAVCKTCCSAAMRVLKKRFGREAWMAQVQLRKTELEDGRRAAVAVALANPAKRAREGDDGLVMDEAAPPEQGPADNIMELFTVGENETLEQVLSRPVLAEINHMFFRLGYPTMAGPRGVLYNDSIWRGLALLSPRIHARVAAAVTSEQVPSIDEVLQLVGDVPPSGSSVVTALAQVQVRPQNAEFGAWMTGLLCSSIPRDAPRKPSLFGRELTAEQVERILKSAFTSAQVCVSEERVAALLWTGDIDRPAVLPLGEAVQVPLAAGGLHAAVAAELHVPWSLVAVVDPLTGAEMPPQTLVTQRLFHVMMRD